MPAAAANLALIVGLGNPGERYDQTRHNAGFWYLDELAGRLGARFGFESRFESYLADVLVGGRKLRLLKPQTFMNNSGRAVQAVARYFDIAVSDILVAHDELDLPPGTVRIKSAGGHGGHNGLRDIIAACGDRNFWRLRIGIGHPGGRHDVIDYVLHRAGVDEQRAIDDAIARVLSESDTVLAGEFERAMHVLHSAPKQEEADGV